MAFSAITPYSPQLLRLPKASSPISFAPNSVSLRFSRPNFDRRKPFSIRSVSVPGKIIHLFIYFISPSRIFFCVMRYSNIFYFILLICYKVRDAYYMSIWGSIHMCDNCQVFHSI